MLNPFPIQWMALIAYALLRLFVGGILLFLGFKHLKYRNELRHTLTLAWWPFGRLSTALLTLSEIGIGLFIILGAYTQYAVLLLMLICIEFIILRPYIAHHSIPTRLFYCLLLGVCLTLFITGAGVVAFDLPL